MKSLQLTEQECNILIQLIDLAIKAGGLNVAEAGVVLSKKISEVLKKNESNLSKSESGAEPSPFSPV